MAKLERIDLIVVHHSASPLTTTAAEIREWHLAKGWDDIGYHAVCEADGKIVEGRDLQDFLMGAQAQGVNQRSAGLCIVGDLRKPSSSWTGAQIVSSREWIRAGLLFLGMTPDRVKGHRDAGTTRTECPGMSTPALRQLLL